jgi:hypothetical protein
MGMQGGKDIYKQAEPQSDVAAMDAVKGDISVMPLRASYCFFDGRKSQGSVCKNVVALFR